jgi:hypothetical protein
VKKYRIRIVIRAKAKGPDFRQLSDEALLALDWFKETKYETVEAENLTRAVIILAKRHLPSLRISDAYIEAFEAHNASCPL